MIWTLNDVGLRTYDDRYLLGDIWLSGSDEVLDPGHGTTYRGPAVVTVVIDREADDEMIITSLSEHDWTEKWIAAGEPADGLLIGV